jgi:hypothetical protein
MCLGKAVQEKQAWSRSKVAEMDVNAASIDLDGFGVHGSLLWRRFASAGHARRRRHRGAGALCWNSSTHGIAGSARVRSRTALQARHGSLGNIGVVMLIEIELGVAKQAMTMCEHF